MRRFDTEAKFWWHDYSTKRFTLYAGYGEEIRPVYASMLKAFKAKKSRIAPCNPWDVPTRIKAGEYYGILVEWDCRGRQNTFHLMNSDYVLSFILDSDFLSLTGKAI